MYRISASTPGTSGNSPNPEGSKVKEPVKPAEPLPDLELALPSSPPPVEDILAARRAKRAAILAKYQAQQSGTSSQINTDNVPSPIEPGTGGDVTRSQSTAPASGVNSVPVIPQPVDDASDGTWVPSIRCFLS